MCIIGGLGHVGLPLGISLADAGKKVVLYDINEEAASELSKGKVPFFEKGAEEVLRRVLGHTLSISSDKKVISDSYFVVIVIGTPVDEHLNPRFTIFKNFIEEIIDYIKDDQHIILRSTIFPGTTEKMKHLLEKHGKKTRISFCPERIAEGYAIEELRSLPQIVASFDGASLNEAGDLFKTLTNEVIFLEPLEAELAKLFTNVWRYLQFSISNQFYQIAIQNGVDFYRIYEAATRDYPRLKGFPRAGFTAGPCLFKDTMQLAAYSNNNFFLGHAAMLINEGLPNFIVQRLKEKYQLKEKTVGILGMAYKGDSDDPRESLSYKLKKILEIEASEVLCSDPFVKDDTLSDLETVITKADILILGTPHSVYKSLNVDGTSRVMVDIWNFFGKGGFF